MKFELENIFTDGIEEEWDEYVDKIIEDYNINAVKIDIDNHKIEVWCYDEDLAHLFNDFNICVGKTIHCEKIFDFDDDYQPIGLNYGDYIETVELHQNGNIYLVRAYCVNNGFGADYAFALFDIEKGE